MKYLLRTAADKYDPKYYGKDSDLRFAVSDAKKFMDHGPLTDSYLLEVIEDEKLTVESCLSALYGIMGKMKDGDILIWYHGGHGANYEYTVDGVTYRQTGRCMHSPGYGFKDPVLWDRLLADVWRLIPSGCTVITISDTCYAEDNNRNVKPASEHLPPMFYTKSRFTKLMLEPTKLAHFKLKLKPGAGLVSISASSAFQTATEVGASIKDPRNGGVFTQALVEVQAHKYGYAPAEFMPLVKRLIPPIYDQTPCIDFLPKSGPTYKRIKSTVL